MIFALFRNLAFYSLVFVLVLLVTPENSKAAINYVQSRSSSAGGVSSISVAFTPANSSGESDHCVCSLD